MAKIGASLSPPVEVQNLPPLQHPHQQPVQELVQQPVQEPVHHPPVVIAPVNLEQGLQDAHQVVHQHPEVNDAHHAPVLVVDHVLDPQPVHDVQQQQPPLPNFDQLFEHEIGVATALEQNPIPPNRLAMMQAKGKWGNCGQTAQGIIDKLTPLGLSARQETEFLGTSDQAGDQLHTLLTSPVQDYTQLNITIDGIHEFTVDKKPDGSVRLSQGYQGKYSAFFWEGLTNQTGLSQAERQNVGSMRDQHGAGNFSLDNLANGLRDLISLGTWSLGTNPPNQEHIAQIKQAWEALPLGPTDPTPHTSRARELVANPIKITVAARTIADPDAAARALGGQDGDFLGPLVVRGAFQALRQQSQEDE